MDDEGGNLTDPIRKKIKCKQFDVDILGSKCEVSLCLANTLKFKQPDFNLMDTTTNCLHLDFNAAGFPEDIDYAIQEQGFVGLRDLSYMSEFFGVKPSMFKDMYLRAITTSQNLTELLLLAKTTEPTSCCTDCGHPLHKLNITNYCTSVSLCEERQEILSTILPEAALDNLPMIIRDKVLFTIWGFANTNDFPKFLKSYSESLKDLVSLSCFKTGD